MKDARYVVLFVAIGLAAAWFLWRPLRRTATRPTAAAAGADLPGAVYAEGTISVPANVDPVGKVLFILARPATGGRPVAVQRIENPAFPLSFRLTTNDAMIPGPFNPNMLEVVARLDADGVAGPKQPDDLEGEVFVEGNERRVRLALRK